MTEQEIHATSMTTKTNGTFKTIFDNETLSGNKTIFDNETISGNKTIFDNKTISGNRLKNTEKGALRHLLDDEKLISRNAIRNILVSCANSASSKQAFLLNAEQVKSLVLQRTDFAYLDEIYLDSVIITIIDMNTAHGWWDE